MTQTKIGVGMINATSIGDAKLLQGNGAWVTASAPGLKFINTTDISDAATYNFTAVDASSYDAYHFLLQNVIPATDNVKFEARTSTDGGSSYDSGASDYAWWSDLWGAYTKDEADDSIQFIGNTAATGYTVGSAASEPGVSGWIWLIGPHLAKFTSVITYLMIKTASTYYLSAQCSAYRLEDADVDAFQLFFASGNIESGTISAYGVANA